MSEHIERGALCQALDGIIKDYIAEKTFQGNFAAGVLCDFRDTVLTKIPDDDVVEVKHGRWKGGYEWVTCSLCEQENRIRRFPYCPTAERRWTEALTMNNRTVEILGVQWSITERSEREDERLKGCDGYSDWTTKEIVVEREIHGTLGNMEAYIHKVLRHEIVHAFLLESGLHECSGPVEAWATNEAMVDWFARQGEKIYAAWREAGALDDCGKRTGAGKEVRNE